MTNMIMTDVPFDLNSNDKLRKIENKCSCKVVNAVIDKIYIGIRYVDIFLIFSSNAPLITMYLMHVL